MKQNCLVAYFTHSENTRKVAETIREKADGAIFEIIPSEAYPQGYNDVVAQAEKEIKGGYRPSLSADIDISPYQVIFVGTPNWWSTIAPPVAAFLESHDFAGKTVVPFCTHGGGGMAHIQRDVQKLCKGAEVPDGLDVYGSGGSRLADTVNSWLQNIL